MRQPLSCFVLGASGARSLVTILTAGASLVRPCGIPRERHLSIAVSDIETNTNGHILAGEEHIDRLLAFFDAGRRVLIVVTESGLRSSVLGLGASH